MADRPAYSAAEDGPRRESDPVGRRRRSRWTVVVGITLGVILVVFFLVLHLTGVLGPTAH
jgi:hypothetical protein